MHAHPSILIHTRSSTPPYHTPTPLSIHHRYNAISVYPFQPYPFKPTSTHRLPATNLLICYSSSVHFHQFFTNSIHPYSLQRPQSIPHPPQPTLIHSLYTSVHTHLSLSTETHHPNSFYPPRSYTTRQQPLPIDLPSASVFTVSMSTKPSIHVLSSPVPSHIHPQASPSTLSDCYLTRVYT